MPTDTTRRPALSTGLTQGFTSVTAIPHGPITATGIIIDITIVRTTPVPTSGRSLQELDISGWSVHQPEFPFISSLQINTI